MEALKRVLAEHHIVDTLDATPSADLMITFSAHLTQAQHVPPELIINIMKGRGCARRI